MRRSARSPLSWLGGLLALYLLAPVVAFIIRLRGGLSSTPGVGSALATSLFTASISAAVITMLGTPLAYLLARGRGIATRITAALVALPLALPPLMGGLLLLYVVGPYTAAGRLFGGELTETRLGIVLAQTFVAAPFLVITARAAFQSVDPDLEDVAASLGHGRVARFARVAVPAALPSIAAGVLLAWLRAFGEFGATLIIAYHPYSLPVFTFVQFNSTGLSATVLPIALALLAAFVVLVLIELRSPRRRAKPPVIRGELASATDPAGVLDFAIAKRIGMFSLDVAHRAHSPRLALLGPSGAGKTMTLRLLAGLLPADDAQILCGQQALHELAAEQRRIGYMPQHSALVARHTVWRQVTFGKRAKAAPSAWWIDRLGLKGLEDRFPDELSGGQQRRVALARALAIQPRVLFLDEPFTGLDAPVKDRLRHELRRLQRDTGLSTVIVTHDPQEAALLADEIVVLKDGRVLQAGLGGDVLNAPDSPEVASLVGIANRHDGVNRGDGRIVSNGVTILAASNGLPEGSKNVTWAIRAEHIRLEPAGSYRAVLTDHVDLGAFHELTVTLGESLELLLRARDSPGLPIGSALAVELPPEQIKVWPRP